MPCFINLEEADFLYASLNSDLQKLERSVAENSISLVWCKEAMIVLKKMHSQFLHFFEKLKLPISRDYVNGLLEEYMEQTLQILDFCNFLKSAISGIDRYRLMVDFAVKNLPTNKSSVTMSKAEIERLKKESKKLYGVERWRDVDLYKAGTTKTKCIDSKFNVIHAVRSAMTIVSMLIFSVIIYPIPIKIDKDLFREFPKMKSFFDLVQKIVDHSVNKFQNAADDPRLAVKETVMIEKAIVDIEVQVVRGIIEQNEKFVKTIELLRQKSEGLKESLDVFESEVTQVFELIVKGRNKVLAMVVAKTAT